MKKIMLFAILIATFFSCTELLDEIEISDLGKELILDSLNNIGKVDSTTVEDLTSVEDSTTVEESVDDRYQNETGSIFFSAQELELWKQRANENHPGWARIQTFVNTFVGNPGADRWAGYWKENSPIPQGDQYAPEKKITGLFTTAFASLITGKNIELCKKELDWYVNNQYLDASNQTRYSRTNIYPPSNVNDGSPGFDMAAGYLKLFLTYQYLYDHITEDKAKYDAFFLGAGEYFDAILHRGLDYAYSDGNVVNSSLTNFSPTILTHDGGYATNSLGRHFNNRRGDYARLIAYLGVYYNNETLKKTAKDYFKGWLTYSIFPDGTMMEMHRGRSDNEEIGWQYSAITANQMTEIADAFARSGDFSLYDYSTSGGVGQSKGGTKTLKLVLESLVNYYDGSWKRNFSGKIINAKVESNGIKYVCYTWFSQANIYYNSSKIKSAYTNCPVTGIQGVGGEAPFVGNSHTSPDKLFMYGNMEGKVSPYSGL